MTQASHSARMTAPWTGPFGGVPPWDQVEPEAFPEAFAAAMAAQRAEIERWAAEASRKKPLVQYVVDPEVVGGLIVSGWIAA